MIAWTCKQIPAWSIQIHKKQTSRVNSVTFFSHCTVKYALLENDKDGTILNYLLLLLKSAYTRFLVNLQSTSREQNGREMRNVLRLEKLVHGLRNLLSAFIRVLKEIVSNNLNFIWSDTNAALLLFSFVSWQVLEKQQICCHCAASTNFLSLYFSCKDQQRYMYAAKYNRAYV